MGIEELLLDRAEKRGFEKGRIQAKDESGSLFVEYLLANTDFDDNKITSLASVDVAFVNDVRDKIGL